MICDTLIIQELLSFLGSICGAEPVASLDGAVNKGAASICEPHALRVLVSIVSPALSWPTGKPTYAHLGHFA
jgi:hypothetical protein